jgi:hypothetical protein
MDVAAIFQNDRKAEFAADPIAGIVADDRRQSGAALTSAVSPGIGTPALSRQTMTKTA